MGFFFKKNRDLNKMEKEIKKVMDEENKQLQREQQIRSKLTIEENFLRDIENYFKSSGFNANESKTLASDLLIRCKNKCEEEQSEKYSGIGTKVFELAVNDEYLAYCVRLARDNGVKDKEIETWWSLSDLERSIIQEVNTQTTLVALTQYLEDGLSSQQAAKKVKKYYAMYGYAENNGDKKRPIPPELKSKVDEYIRTMTSSELMISSFKLRLEKYSNFNELVRTEWFDRIS
ncbi:MAG: hypothetical protein KMY55_03300 [Dethiosulfatibacter sp.]|nr:hypothetical protein [Dethiosulfatibacter sp.]